MCDDDLARAKSRKLFAERLEGFGLRAAKLAGREIHRREPGPLSLGDESNEVRWSARVEAFLVEYRSRADDAHDLALDDSFRRRRILDVLERQFVFSIALGPLVRELRGRAERFVPATFASRRLSPGAELARRRASGKRVVGAARA